MCDRERESWVLCPVLVNAGGSACKGSGSLERALAREERLCSHHPHRSCLSSRRLPVAAPILGSVCGHSLAPLVPGSPAVAEVGHALGGTLLVASAPIHQLCWGAAGCSRFLSHCPPAASLCSERLLGCSLQGESGRGRDPSRPPPLASPCLPEQAQDPARLKASTALPCCGPGWAPRPPCCLWSGAVDSLLLIESWEGTLWR